MMTRSKGKKCRMWASQVVHIQDPPITSPAQLVLLAKKYAAEDKSIYTKVRMNKIRNRWMKQQMKQPDLMNGLTCSCCGQMGLQPWTQNIDIRAVLDHKIEIANGGDWKDPSNFQVLCDKCNNEKNRKLQETFLHPEDEIRYYLRPT